MGDVVFVVLGVGLFLASTWYVIGCERLIRPDPSGDAAIGAPRGDGSAADPAGRDGGAATAADRGAPR